MQFAEARDEKPVDDRDRLGFPAITVVTTTTQSATNDGDDEGENTQTTSADVKPDVDASVVPK